MLPAFLNWGLESHADNEIICKHIYVFGEMHFINESVTGIEHKIRSIKPSVILHELAYADKCLTNEVLKDRIKNAKPGELCDPELNIDVYKLALELNAKLIGIDPEVRVRTTHKPTVFEHREFEMLKKVREWGSKNPADVICVVVGDTHLRSKGFTDGDLVFKPSELYTALKNNPKVTIQRADKKHREVE